MITPLVNIECFGTIVEILAELELRPQGWLIGRTLQIYRGKTLVAELIVKSIFVSEVFSAIGWQEVDLNEGLPSYHRFRVQWYEGKPSTDTSWILAIVAEASELNPTELTFAERATIVEHMLQHRAAFNYNDSPEAIAIRKHCTEIIRKIKCLGGVQQ